MQIAQIVPKVRTQKEAVFDYSIPPKLLPQVKCGILVEVPFHGRNKEGIIIDIKRTSKIPSLKPINKIIDPNPVVDETHIELARWMADYYLAPLGKTLFENIVPPAKRILEKYIKGDAPLRGASPVSSPVSYKKYLIVGDFKERLKFYLEASKKTLNQNKSIIILVPDLTLLRFFQNQFDSPVAIIHAGMTKTQRWLEWQKIRQGKTKIVLGSISALFAPIKNLGLVIIDQEENETYKNDRSPRFHAVKVAETLSKLTGVNLVLGSLTPSIESYFKSLKNIYVLKKTTFRQDHHITIVNLAGRFQAISHPLQEKIQENLKNRKKIILVLNRKGEGTKYLCPDCLWLAICKKCGLPLTEQKNKLLCFRCGTNTLPPQNCPKCQNAHLGSFGLGTNKLEKFVKDFWPQARLIRLEEGTNLNPHKAKWDIAIATSYGLKFNFPPIGLVGIIDADQNLNFPDFRSPEKNFQIIYKFLKIAEQGIIQTNSERNPVVAAAAKLDFEKFFLDELEVRRKNGFPPFMKLIRLLYRNQNEEKTQKETKKIYSELKKILQKQKDSGISFFGPTPAFFKKKRGYFRWQIIIKIPVKIKKDETRIVTDYLKTLSQGWIVDVDPTDLL